MMTEISHRSIRVASRARLLLSTALIGLAPLIFMPDGANAQQAWLDNNPDGGDPISGTWSADSEIWDRRFGWGPPVLTAGTTGVLHHSDPEAAIELTIDGEVLADALRLESGDYTLSGGEIRPFGGELTFDIAAERTLTVSSILRRYIRVTGEGTLHYLSEEPGTNGLYIGDGATLISEGLTRQLMEVDGTALLSGTHEGGVNISETGEVRGVSEINGRVENDGIAELGGSTGEIENRGTLDVDGELAASRIWNLEDAQLAVAAGERLQSELWVHNFGDMSIAGELAVVQEGRGLRNYSDGVLALDGASLSGDLINNEGGNIELRDAVEVNGSVTNRGRLEVQGDTANSLEAVDGTVTHSGEIVLTGAGRFSILAREIVLQGDARIDGSVIDLIGDIFNQATLLYSGTTTLAGNLVNRGLGLATIAGTLDANGTEVMNRGTMIIAAESEDDAGTVPGGRLENVTTLVSRDQLTIGRGGSVQADLLSNRAEGEVHIAGSLTGDLENYSQASVTLDEGQISGDVSNSGLLAGSGAIGGDVTNRGTLRVDDLLTVGGLGNTGQVEIGGDDTLRSASDISNDGTISLSGLLEITSVDALLTNNGGGRIALDGGRIEAGLNNEADARLEVSGTASIAGDLENRGIIDKSNGAASLTVEGGTFHNWGRVTGSGAGRLAIHSAQIILESGSYVDGGHVDLIGEVLNGGELDFSRDTELNGDLDNAESGLARVRANVDAAGFDVSNAGTFIVQDEGNGDLFNVGTLTNSHVFTIENEGSVQADAAINEAGAVLTIAGALDAPLTNRADGSVLLEGGQITGALTNAGTLSGSGLLTGDLLNDGTASLAGAVSGAVTNNGSLRTEGDLSAGSVQNSGSLRVANGHRLSSGSTVGNDGSMIVAGQVNAGVANGAGADLTLNNGRITGAVTNDGQLTGNGHIGGALTNNGTASISGSAGAVSNTGGLSTSGDLAVSQLTNDGQATVGAGHQLTAAGGVTNNQTLTLNGNLQGDLRNSADATTTLGPRSGISGDVVNDGTISGRATIGGALDNNGQATLGGSVGAVDNAGALTVDGRLDVASLNNSGEIGIGADDQLRSQGDIRNSGTIALDGRLEVTGEGSDIRNLDGGTIRMDGATVIGDVVNASGALIDIVSSSLVQGDLTNRGDIDMSAASDDVRLHVDGGTFTNSGAVTASGGGQLTIEADVIALEEGSDVDGGQVELIGAVTNEGNLRYAEDATLTGTLRNGDNGHVRVTADLDAAGNNIGNSGTFIVDSVDGSTGNIADIGNLSNSGVLRIAAGSSVGAGDTQNLDGGQMRIAGALESDLDNAAGGQVQLVDGRIGGDVANAGRLTGSGDIDGSLDNRGVVNLTGTVGDVDNSGTATLNGRMGDVANSGTATLAGQAGQITSSGTLTTGGALNVTGLTNDGTLAVADGHRLTSDSRVSNNQHMTVDGVLDAGLVTVGELDGSGQITGNVSNSGQMDWGGSIGGNLGNLGSVRTTGDVAIAGAVDNGRDGGGASLNVQEGHRLSADGGVTNRRDASLVVDGTLAGDVLNRGSYQQTGTLDGSLTTRGSATLGGQISGNVDYVAGDLVLRDGLAIGGDFTLGRNIDIAAGQGLSAGRVIVSDDVTLGFAGTLDGALRNNGTMRATGNAVISGQMHNAGHVDLTTDRQVGTVLQVGGLQGNGSYALDVDLAEMTSDSIVVRGGAAQGNHHFILKNSAQITAQPGLTTTLLDVDETQGAANDFSFSYDEVIASSERVIFWVDQTAANGDLALHSGVNPGLGALFGNVTLTQSLIGSVINRPTSPFVTGLAYEDSERPCGPGAWARVTGGHATATGATDNGDARFDSEIRADYYGMQVGSDLACFDGRYGGWDMALGVLGGVNQGDTYQPVYAVNGATGETLDTITSVTTADFTQVYGGVYATATRGRFQADLQYRYENSDFNISNRAVVGTGLGLDDVDFSSRAHTLSGSVSYAMPLGEQGWAVVPTAGFAWSRMSTDAIELDNGDRLSLEDSDRQVGFVGATLARTYVQPEDNSALYAFVTGTWYKDFADPTVSVFTREVGDADDSQRLVSDNLGAYGEISVGANYIKVLSATGRGRQFSTSARIDARYGDGLDSVGVTGQLRWQF